MQPPAVSRKHVGGVTANGNIPAEVLVEGRGGVEHVDHPRHSGEIPIVQRLVEGLGDSEHPFHRRHSGDIPVIQRLVERHLFG